MASNYNLDSLIADLKKNTYTPKTDAELQAEANNRYQSAYDQKRFDAQQAYDTNQQALERQLSSLGAITSKQKEASALQYDQARSQADRTALSHGFGRSSYNLATQANIAIAGNKAQQEISDAEATARTGLEDQKTLLARQLADLLKQYSASQAADTLSYLDQLEQREYDRSTASTNQQNSLAAQIYQFANQEQQQNNANDQWLKQFNEQIRQYNESAAQNQAQFDALHPTSTGGGSGSRKPKWEIDGVDYKNKAAYDAEMQRRQNEKDRKSAILLGMGPFESSIAALNVLRNNPKYKPVAQNATGKRGLQD